MRPVSADLSSEVRCPRPSRMQPLMQAIPANLMMNTSKNVPVNPLRITTTPCLSYINWKTSLNTKGKNKVPPISISVCSIGSRVIPLAKHRLIWTRYRCLWRLVIFCPFRYTFESHRLLGYQRINLPSSLPWPNMYCHI